MLLLLAVAARAQEEAPQRFHIRNGQGVPGYRPPVRWHYLDHLRLYFHQALQRYVPTAPKQNSYDGAHWGSRADGQKYFWEPGWVDDGLFDPKAHDPRFSRSNSTRRRLEENRCEASDICCSLCKNDLQTCWRMAGYLVEDKYYPSEQSVTGSCDDIDRRTAALDVFGPGKTFRDNDLCQSLVHEYICLWWGSEAWEKAYENDCASKGVILVPPCRPFCVQVAIQCANSLEYQKLCEDITCPPIEETCMPEPRSVATVVRSKSTACEVYRYSTQISGYAQGWYDNPGLLTSPSLGLALLTFLL